MTDYIDRCITHMDQKLQEKVQRFYSLKQQGSHLRKKPAFFTQKRSRLRKYENAVRLQYAKTVTSHIKMRLVFSFFTPSRESL